MESSHIATVIPTHFPAVQADRGIVNNGSNSQHPISDLYRLYEQQLSSHIRDAVILLDMDFTILSWNQAAEALYEWKAEEVIGRQLGEILPARYVDVAQTQSLSQLYENGSWKGEVIHKSKNKKKLYVFSAMHLLYEEKAAKGVLMVNQSLSVEKDSQHDLDIAHRRLHFHINNTPLGYIQWDHQFCVEMWSSQAESILGWSAEEMKGKSVYDACPIYQEDMEIFNRAVVEALAKGLQRFKTTLRNVTRDGEVLYCEWYNSLLRDENGKLVSVLSFVNNISEIEASERKIRKIAESVPGILYQYTLHKDGQEHFEFINKASDEFGGRFNSKQQQGFDWIWHHMATQDLEELRQKIGDSEKKLSRLEHEFRVKCGNNIRWFRAIAQPEQNPGSHSTTWTGIVMDITTHRKVTEDLERRNFELSNFAYKVSHDVRAPLCSMTGLVDLLRKEDNPALFFRYLDLIDASIQRLDHFILNVLSHIQVTSSRVAYTPVHLQQVLETTFSELSYIPYYHRLEKAFNLQEEYIYTDKNLLAEIFKSLASNSIKYQDRRKERSFVEISVASDPEYIYIDYKDNGLGIKTDHLPKIFDMFYRASEQSQGSGIGLYIMKQAVEKMNGRVAVTSQVSTGTTFSIVLPNRIGQKQRNL